MLNAIAERIGKTKFQKPCGKEQGPKLETFSDENLKNIYGEIDDRIIEDFAKLSAIDYKYNEQAQQLGTDDKEHVGVIAQELEAMPTTKHVVIDNCGHKAVDIAQMTMTDTAAIAELSRRVLALEEAVKRMNGGN